MLSCQSVVGMRGQGSKHRAGVGGADPATQLLTMQACEMQKTQS
jgi:hypothetical protein